MARWIEEWPILFLLYFCMKELFFNGFFLFGSALSLFEWNLIAQRQSEKASVKSVGSIIGHPQAIV
jgi:hypothetical protein